VVGPVVARLGESRALILGLVFGAAGFSIYAWAPSSGWFWLGVPVTALWGLAGPAAQGLMTRRVKPTEQGQLQGAYSSLRGVAGLFGPVLFTLTFARFIEPGARWHLPGAPWLLAGALLFAACLMARRVTRQVEPSTAVAAP
jgi:DHA1 family tetracycline resistance protein-like MFS transporter